MNLRYMTLELPASRQPAYGASQPALDDTPLLPFAENVVRGLIKVGRRAHRYVASRETDQDKQHFIRFTCCPALSPESWVAVVTSAATQCAVVTDRDHWKFSDSISGQGSQFDH
jgi:hypothetical protein